MMKVKFKYRYSVEYYLKVYSKISIGDEGLWEVDEGNLAEEYSTSEFDTFQDFIDDYFWMELNLDPDYIDFDEKDLSKLETFCKNW